MERAVQRSNSWARESRNLDFVRADFCVLPTMLYCSPYLVSQDPSMLQAPGLKTADKSFALLTVWLLKGGAAGFGYIRKQSCR